MGKSLRGQNLRGKAGARCRSKGSPPAKKQELGDYWRPDLLRDNARSTQNSTACEGFVEEARKKLKLFQILLQERDATIQSFERKETLRTQSTTQQTGTNHYIPNADESSPKGRPLTLESLRCVASICASGSQYSKVCIVLCE